MSLSLARLLGSTVACTVVLLAATWAVDRSVGSGADPVATAPPPAGAATLTIAGFAFTPAPLSVSPGTVVAVTNQDRAKHTVTSGTREAPDGRFDLKLDGSGTATFTAPSEPGTYPYLCTIHPGMKATLEVHP